MFKQKLGFSVVCRAEMIIPQYMSVFLSSTIMVLICLVFPVFRKRDELKIFSDSKSVMCQLYTNLVIRHFTLGLVLWVLEYTIDLVDLGCSC